MQKEEERKTATELLYESGIDIGSMNDDFNCKLFYAMERYAEQFKVKCYEWVNVEDKLPELSEPLMGYNDDNVREVIIPNFKATVLGYNNEIGVFKAHYTKNGWSEISSISSSGIQKPTHWTPLLNKPNI